MTANGEECHNEWEITFEEIHRNSAIAFAIKKYIDYTADYGAYGRNGLGGFDRDKSVLGTTSQFFESVKAICNLRVLQAPMSMKIMSIITGTQTTVLDGVCNTRKDAIVEMQQNDSRKLSTYLRENQIFLSMKLVQLDRNHSGQCIYPIQKTLDLYIQHDGFLNKELTPVSQIPQRISVPINQNWSWDRILRSPYIKQADLLQGFYFFSRRFHKCMNSKNTMIFMKIITVHESSLSPCIHCIQSVKLDYIDQAHAYFPANSSFGFKRL